MFKTYIPQYTWLCKEKFEAKILVEVLVVYRWARHMAWLYCCAVVFSSLVDKTTRLVNIQKN